MCREMQHPRPSEAQALERALPQNPSLSPSEQLIMEVGICFFKILFPVTAYHMYLLSASSLRSGLVVHSGLASQRGLRSFPMGRELISTVLALCRQRCVA